uniref:Glutamate receptor ionotropic, kainate 5-like n=1 Tax=Dermatophagoides pteronyssinus TaxID=6956 RepID=A0A6P6Y957_DERPT
MKSLILNRTLTIAYTNTLPYSKIDNNHQAGIEYELLKTLSEIFQFKMIFIDCKDDYGIRQPNGNWTGIMGKIFNNEANIGIGGIVVTFNRISAIKFLYPHWLDSLTFGTTIPHNHVPLDIYFQPFTPIVWLCLFISLILFPVLNLYHQYEQNNNYAFNLLWINLSLLLRQPYYSRIRLTLSQKMTIITWMLSLIILTNIYSSYLCARFAIKNYNVIDTCDKLADACDNNEIIPLLEEKTVVFSLFKTDSSIRTIRSVAHKLRGISHRSEGEQLITVQTHKEQYALVSSFERIQTSQLLFGSESFYLPPASSESSFFPLLVGFPIQLPDDLIQPFEIWIMRITSSGLMECWKNRITMTIRESFIERRNTKQFDSSMKTNIDEGFNLSHFDRLANIFLSFILIS